MRLNVFPFWNFQNLIKQLWVMTSQRRTEEACYCWAGRSSYRCQRSWATHTLQDPHRLQNWSRVGVKKNYEVIDKTSLNVEVWSKYITEEYDGRPYKEVRKVWPRWHEMADKLKVKGLLREVKFTMVEKTSGKETCHIVSPSAIWPQ